MQPFSGQGVAPQGPYPGAVCPQGGMANPYQRQQHGVGQRPGTPSRPPPGVSPIPGKFPPTGVLVSAIKLPTVGLSNGAATVSAEMCEHDL